MNLIPKLSKPAQVEPDSGIVKVAMHGFTKQGIIAFWSGEGNLPTPELFSKAASESLHKGETFYTFQGGIPELRQALARYHTRHYGRAFDADNFFVTSGGMPAIQTALQMIVADGDEIIIPTPAWPNYAGALRIQGARPVEVPMTFQNGKWALDLDQLFAATTARTKAICLNSPSNPLGWVATKDDLIAVRDFCRKHGIWILGDEVYSHFYFGADGKTRAPSFLDICDSEEQLMLCNTFSKNWAMTGWRVGWIQAPKILGPVIERVVQYNTSGTPVFLQRGCVVALDEGDEFIKLQVGKARKNRNTVIEALKGFPQLRLSVPEGAFYAFFGIDGMKDSMATALRIIDEANVGFAPGAAFGAAGEGFLRMCYLKEEHKLAEGLDRFSNWLKNNRPT
ncbi:MAG: pyridoxal phosphate-dependent aminotransferase [Alphaproteobacteria bacterium]|nr:pyridoxal phosphate-dependent aminotransferase [Alphaproteobacteria bacterium]